jgi:hypothetical protein
MEPTAPQSPAFRRSHKPFSLLAILVPAGATLLAHLLTATGYGFGGGELYAIACSEHPAGGFVDLGPVPVLLLAVQRLIGGDAPLAIRAVSAVLSALTVAMAGLLTRRMGAGPFGQFLAALCASIAPAVLLAGHVATPNAFALLAWTTCTYLVMRIAEESRPRWWILLGVVLAAGLLSSFTTAVFAIALALGILLTPLRRHVASVWPWAALATVIVLLLPWIIWQAWHHWPTIAWLGAAYDATSVFPPFAYVLEQIKIRQPLTLPVWLTGLIVLFFAASFRRWMFIAWAYLITAVMMYAAHIEPHHLIPASIGLIAAGSVVVERVLAKQWMRTGTVVLLLAAGLATLPMGIPVLAPRTFMEYEKTTGFRIAMGSNECTDRLPGYYGTMFGRKELAVVMNAVFSTMPPEDRAQYGILCEDAVQAAALNFYRQDYTFPAAVSADNQCWYWGAGGFTGDKLVVVGGNAAGLQGLFDDVRLRMRFRDEYLHPGNRITPIWLVSRPRAVLPEVWERLRTVH